MFSPVAQDWPASDDQRLGFNVPLENVYPETAEDGRPGDIFDREIARAIERRPDEIRAQESVRIEE